MLRRRILAAAKAARSEHPRSGSWPQAEDWKAPDYFSGSVWVSPAPPRDRPAHFQNTTFQPVKKLWLLLFRPERPADEA
jgi:hypothetical protein